MREEKALLPTKRISVTLLHGAFSLWCRKNRAAIGVLTTRNLKKQCLAVGYTAHHDVTIILPSTTKNITRLWP